MKKIFVKIFGGFIALILILSALLLAFSLSTIRIHYQEAMAQELIRLGREISHDVLAYLEKGELRELDIFLKKIGRDIETRLTVVDAQGNVLGDSEKDPSAMESHRYRPEIDQALTGRVSQSLRFSYTVEEQMLYVGLPLEGQGRIMAVLRLSLFLKDIQALLHHMRISIFLSALLAAGLALLAALFFTLHLTAPIKKLKTAGRQLTAGKFETRIRIRHKDEFRELGDSFNWMTEKISRLYADLNVKSEELTSILASVQEGLAILDRQEKIVLANQAFQNFFAETAVKGKFIWEILRNPQVLEMISRVRVEKDRLVRDGIFQDKNFLWTIGYLKQQDGILLTMYDLSAHERRSVGTEGVDPGGQGK